MKPKWILQWWWLKCFYSGLHMTLECMDTKLWPISMLGASECLYQQRAHAPCSSGFQLQQTQQWRNCHCNSFNGTAISIPSNLRLELLNSLKTKTLTENFCLFCVMLSSPWIAFDFVSSMRFTSLTTFQWFSMHLLCYAMDSAVRTTGRTHPPPLLDSNCK